MGAYNQTGTGCGAIMSFGRDDAASITQILQSGDTAAAVARLRMLVSPDDDFPDLRRAARLWAGLPRESLGLKPLKLAILASSTVDQLAEILAFWLGLEGYEADIWVAPFDTLTATVLDPGSQLYSFAPDIVWLFGTHRDVRLEIAPGDGQAVAPAVQAAVEARVRLWAMLQDRLHCVVIDNNADIPSGDALGNFAGQAAWSQRNSLRRYNLALADAAPAGVAIFDLDHLSAQCGKRRWVDARYWHHSKNSFDLNLLGQVGFQGARLIAATRGGARKCLVLDLDNTLWGGVIGDDGVEGIKLGQGAAGEAFVDFQRWVKSLQERGVVLAVCSKNALENAQAPFLNHPDMRLSLDDIAVFRANWENKADNIADIARTLNIGLDSLVFVDDNPVERDLVRRYLPMVAVPELPEDPSDYIAAVEAHGYFEMVNFSDEDRERTKLYRTNAVRAEQSNQFADHGDYLRSLEMTAVRGPIDAFHLPRMAQLINKSNQFNLTTRRYSEADLVGMGERPDTRVRRYRLKDRHGDNGLISVVILKAVGDGALDIDLWVMSCRVLARTMEAYIVNDLIDQARALGCDHLTGTYLPTAKNGLVADLYERLGFQMVSRSSNGSTWRLDITPDTPSQLTFVMTAGDPAEENPAHA